MPLNAEVVLEIAEAALKAIERNELAEAQALLQQLARLADQEQQAWLTWLAQRQANERASGF